MRVEAGAPLDKGARDASGIVRVWRWISRACPQIAFEMVELLYNVYAIARLLPLFLKKKDAVYYQRHAFFLFAGVWLAKMCGHRVILEVNETAGVDGARKLKCLALARWIGRQTFRRADEILTVSPLLQRIVLARGGRAGHVHVVPNAIDPARFSHPHGEYVRARLGFTDARVVGFVGWFDRWDRLDRLIELVQELHQRDPSVRLLVVGDGVGRRELSERIAHEGLEPFFVLSGPISRAAVPDYIDAMDVCVLPDATEFCSPLVLFEFMALGKPVVAPDAEPIRGVLAHGSTGWIFDRADRSALRAGVERLLLDPVLSRRIGAAARLDVFEHHTWDAIAAMVAQLAVRRLEDPAVDRARSRRRISDAA
jgi:glycosyltransferase involved in cell wall biosynthesis